MKYAFLFFALGAGLVFMARSGNSFLSLIFYWPAVCCVAVGVCYLFYSPVIFAKQKNGKLHLAAAACLAPFLALTWTAWHALRVFGRENAYDELDEKITIGRRLLPAEFPKGIDNVVDLTAEFNEPQQIAESVNYLSIPILDASIVSVSELDEIVAKVSSLDGKTYIHCAQGHGRTGLVTAALLMHHDSQLSPDAAIAMLQKVRPALDCNKQQLDLLKRWRAS